MKHFSKLAITGLSLSLLASSCSATLTVDGVKPGPTSSASPGTGSTAGTTGSTGSTGNTSTTAPTVTGGVSASADSKLTLVHSGKDFANGSTYLLPENSPTAGAVAIFSEIRERLGVANNTGKPVQIEKAEILPLGDVKDEEFILQDTPIGWRTDETPDRRLELPAQTLADKQALDLYVRFYPIAGGERKAQLVVTHDGGKKFAINLVGKGRPDGKLLSKGTTVFTKVAGSVKDELTSTMIGGSDGSLYFSANQKEILDKYYDDILVGGLNADGSRKWLKIFNGPFKESQPDPGQNNETGGDQHAMAMGPDGMLYIVGAASAVRQNNIFYTMVLKVDPKTGALVWGKLWNPAKDTATIKTSATAYGLDVSGDRVFVTGTTGSNQDQADAHVMLLALNTQDGSVKYQKSFELAPGYNDRGYAIKADGKGNLYIGGLSNGDGFLVRVKGVDGDTPEVDWARQVGMGVGSNVNGIDVDAAGDAYLSLDRRGATTYFSTARVSTDGRLVWGKTYNGANLGAKNNSNLVRVLGNRLFIGGRIGQSEYDGQMGDGFLAEMSLDGALSWSTFHFNGKGPDELAEHRVKGIALMGNSLYIGGQVYTGSYNHKRYDGYWYDGTSGLEAYAPSLTDLGKPNLLDLSATSRLQESSVAGQWVDAPDAVTVQNARGKQDGSNSDGEFFVSKIDLK